MPAGRTMAARARSRMSRVKRVPRRDAATIRAAARRSPPTSNAPIARRVTRTRCPPAEPSPAPTAWGSAPTSAPVNRAKAAGRSPITTLRTATRSVSRGSPSPSARSAGRRRAPPARSIAARNRTDCMRNLPNGLHGHCQCPWPPERHEKATGIGSHIVGRCIRGRMIAMDSRWGSTTRREDTTACCASGRAWRWVV